MSWRLFKRRLKPQMIVLILFVVSYIIQRYFNITCIIYKVTGIPCPTCYMGRALISLLKGDIDGYIGYNIMALPVAAAFAGELFIDAFSKYRKAVHIYSISVLCINMVFYLHRLGIF